MMGRDVITDWDPILKGNFGSKLRIKYECSIEEIFDIRSLHIVSYLSGNLIGLSVS